MTTEEFSVRFDVLYNNISSNMALGINEYEKSLFLTKAQDEIIKAYFSPKLNKVGEGIDASPSRQVDFSMLIRTKISNPVTTDTQTDLPYGLKNTKCFTFPTDILFPINETTKVYVNGIDGTSSKYTDDTTAEAANALKHLIVVPLNSVEYSYYMNKAYKHPPKNQAWRVMAGTKKVTDSVTAKDSDASLIQIIAGPFDDIKTYTIRYVKRPSPIVLCPLDSLSINGENSVTQCELDPIIHEDILQRAVELAKAAYSSTTQEYMALNNASMTEKGIIAQPQQPAQQ